MMANTKEALRLKTVDEQMRREHRIAGSMAVMGISNLHYGAALARAGSDAAAAIMRWDLINPWARFYELNSTHPLTALRATLIRTCPRPAAELGARRLRNFHLVC